MGSIKRPRKVSGKAEDSALGDFVTRNKETAEGLSVSSRQKLRDKMQADIDAFLAAGGKIQHFDITMSAEKLSHR